MSRVLVIGCGGVASVAIRKCCQVSDIFQEICIASRTKSKCDQLAENLKGKTATKITTARVDADDVELWPKIQKIYPEMKFKLITFENTPENAREILANMGKNIDVIAGIFDETMLELRGCDGTEISREPFCVAVSIHHRLAKKEKITLDDLAGENLMMVWYSLTHSRSGRMQS